MSFLPEKWGLNKETWSNLFQVKQNGDEKSTAKTDKEREEFLKKALNAIAIPSSTQLKVLELAKKLEDTYKKASNLVGEVDESDSGNINLSWWQIVGILTFVSKVLEGLHKKKPSLLKETFLEQKARPAKPLDLQLLSYYLEFADMAYDGDQDQTLQAFLERVNYVEVFHCKLSDFEVPAFYMAFDPEQKNVLISIKGTSSVSDVITDMLCSNSKFLSNSYAHSGMMNGAHAVIKKIKPFVVNLFQPQNYGYTLVGHSLGAGVAALTGMILKETFSIANVQVYAIGCPPVTDLKTALEADYITCVVNNRDIIPRVSLSNMRIMNRTLFALKELVQSGVTPDQLLNNPEKKGTNDNESTPDSTSDNYKLKPEEITISDFLDVARNTAEKYKLRYEDDLYVPGQVYVLYDGPNGYTEAIESNGTLYFLRQALVGKAMLTDHLCESYRDAIHDALCAGAETVEKYLEPEDIAGTHISCTDYQKFNVPDEPRNPITFYKISTSIIQHPPRDLSEYSANSVAQFITWRRYSQFEKLKADLLGLELGSLPSLPSKILFTTPESRIPVFTTFLKSVSAKSIKRKNQKALEIVLDFVGAKEDSTLPQYIQEQLKEPPAEDGEQQS